MFGHIRLTADKNAMLRASRVSYTGVPQKGPTYTRSMLACSRNPRKAKDYDPTKRRHLKHVA